MVLDLKQIELKKAVHDNALWVVEQIPGLVAYDDVSMILREGRLEVTINGNMLVSRIKDSSGVGSSKYR